MTQKSSSHSSSPWQKDLLASIVVFLVALPLCMGIAIASGVPVSAGLLSGIIGGIVVGVLAGCPLQVSGPAAGLTVVVYDAVQRHGLEMLGPIVLLAGAMQIIAGSVRIGQWFRAVSPAVVMGMLSGIGVLIFASQFHVMVDDLPKKNGVRNLAAIPEAIGKAFQSPELPSQDIRKEQRDISMKLGELHRQQVQLSEHLAAQGEFHPDAEAPVPSSPPIEDFPAEQQQIRTEVEALLAQSLSLYESQPNKQQGVREAGEKALAAIDLSLRELEGGHRPAKAESQLAAADAINELMVSKKNHQLAAFIGIIAIVILIAWKAFTRGNLALVPGPLVAVVATLAVAALFQLPIMYVEVPASIMDEMQFPRWEVLQQTAWQPLISTAILIAVIASAETLLCATAVDQIQSGPRTKYNQELFAQGVGNVLCGAVGALPMTGVIVRSSANIQAGGKTRLSAILHGIWLLIFVVALGTFLRLIPTAALAAILVYTGWKLINWKAFKELAEFGWGEVVIYLVTIVTIVVEDLLIGVLVGLALAIVKMIYRFTRLKVRYKEAEGDTATLELDGMATFLKLPNLAKVIEAIPRGKKVTINIDRLNSIDHACLNLMTSWADQHESTGGEVIADWDLMKRFVRDGHLPESRRGEKMTQIV